MKSLISFRSIIRISLLLASLVISLQPVILRAQDGSSRKILFVSDRNRAPGIFVVGADGSGLQRIADGMNLSSTAWSPDGKRIASVSREDGNWEIYVMDADGGNPQRLTNNKELDWSPGWSSDGKQIVYLSKNTKGSNLINIVDADGGNPRTVLTQYGVVTPAWSPDGKSIAYGSSTGLFVMTSDGKNRRRIGPAGYDPSWSPDSKIHRGHPIANRSFTGCREGKGEWSSSA
jgi:Tol biopolymer transport system component